MEASEVAGLLAEGSVAALLADAELASVVADLPALQVDDAADMPLDLNRLLGLASWMSSVESEEAQNAVLRATHACLVEPTATAAQRAAALVLLERVGNRPAVRLARSRDLLGGVGLAETPAVLQLDVSRARNTYAIPAGAGTLSGNQFQRDFWSKIADNDWLSVSAATSAGKSFIVRQWFDRRLSETDRFVGVYVVPTRALIDEVGRELRELLPDEVAVVQFPWDARAGETRKEVYVLTQERLHLVLDRFPDFRADVVFVDEAQKFGDDSRGVLLQRTLDELSRRSAATQVIFASPLSENPEMLLELAPAGARRAAMLGQTVTVLQNLLWVDQVPRQPMRWRVALVTDGEPRAVGEIALPARADRESKRLPFVAVALTAGSGSSVIYANGAADAEKMAAQIADLLSSDSESAADPGIAALVELSESTIHRNYALNGVLKKGVAFHYGNMPQLVRSEIERLFRDGAIRYLVCTSTLLEGVNLPCRNLFMRGPTRGRGNKLAAADFWNLAGRAGRWGKEFQGNVVCVDASLPRVWPDPPKRRVRYPLIRATDTVLDAPDALFDYIASGTPVGEGQGRPPLESVFSYLCARVSGDSSLDDVPGLGSLDQVTAMRLEQAVRSALDDLDIPSSLIMRHAGISPVSMQRLLDLFRSYEDKTQLALTLPESEDAVDAMVRALGRISSTVAEPFGSGGRTYMLALLIIQWMRGHPLAQIIAGRISNLEQRDRTYKLATVIRECMNDVEQIARFEAPKYLSCYVDLLRLHYREEGMVDAMAELPDVAMLLELGVSRTTELSLMTLGLSRSTATALGEFVTSDALTADECLEWIRANDLEALALPALVRREISLCLETHPMDSGGGEQAS